MKKISALTCESFTVIMVLFALAPSRYAPAISNSVILQGFAMALSIALLMTAAEKIENESILIDAAVKVVICYLVVFLEGALFGMIPFSLSGLWEITPVLIPAFLITYFVHFFSCMEWASSINKSIRRKK